MSDSERLKLALVGCGNIARAHWRGITYHAPQIEVTAAVDANPERAAAMAERTGAAAFSSLSEALADGEFDAVDIMLPHNLHEPVALEALAAGKHVVLEKPMAPTLEACERILQGAAQAGTVFMIAEQSQYWPDVVRARELIEAGAIGDVISVRAYFFDPLRRDPADPKPWRFQLDRSGGGIAIDGGAHWLRPLRMWLGEVDEVIATTSRPVADMEGESQAHAILRFAGGQTASFDLLLSDTTASPHEDFRITGSTGELVIRGGREGWLKLFDREHPEGELVMETFPGRADAFGFELQEFSQAVLHGAPLTATPEFSLGELRTGLAIYRSAASGRWEKVWDAPA